MAHYNKVKSMEHDGFVFNAGDEIITRSGTNYTIKYFFTASMSGGELKVAYGPGAYTTPGNLIDEKNTRSVNGISVADMWARRLAGNLSYDDREKYFHKEKEDDLQDSYLWNYMRIRKGDVVTDSNTTTHRPRVIKGFIAPINQTPMVVYEPHEYSSLTHKMRLCSLFEIKDYFINGLNCVEVMASNNSKQLPEDFFQTAKTKPREENEFVEYNTGEGSPILRYIIDGVKIAIGDHIDHTLGRCGTITRIYKDGDRYWFDFDTPIGVKHYTVRGMLNSSSNYKINGVCVKQLKDNFKASKSPKPWDNVVSPTAMSADFSSIEKRALAHYCEQDVQLTSTLLEKGKKMSHLSATLGTKPIETRVLVLGNQVNKLQSDECLSLIQQLENDKKALSEIKTKSKAVGRHIAAIDEAIVVVVEHLDGLDSE